MGLVVSDAERDQGVVYLDASQQVAATHALVIGVGQYASQQLSSVVSPTVAARMVGDWFLDGMDENKPGGFLNTDKPLGSLSVLLSELPEGKRSRFADTEVPRATFDNVKKAVEAWIDRASSHPDNFLFLFISSHGESFGRRTAFLLEDYGTSRLDVTAGMSEIEQFVEALANVDAKQQLLIFDCCRTPTSLGLRFDQEFGTRLVNLPATNNRRIRRAHVLRSTGLGFEAFGRKDGPTIFAQVLLDALRGLAASSNDDWTVDNFGLARTVARLLDLHERNDEPLQMPDSQLNAPFVVSTVQATDTATVFVSLGPQYDFSTCTIHIDDSVFEGARSVSDRIAPFARLELPKFTARKIGARDAAGKLIGEVHIEPVPPVAFKELPESFKGRRSPKTKSYVANSGQAQLSLSLHTTANSPMSDSVAVIMPGGTLAATAKPITMVLAADGSKKTVNVAPGRYDIRLVTWGRTLFSTIEAKADASTEVKLQLPGPGALSNPPVRDAEMATIRAAARTDDQGQKGDSWLVRMGVRPECVVVGECSGTDIFAAPISPALLRRMFAPCGAGSPDGESIDPGGVTLTVRSPGVFGVEDKIERRLPQHFKAGQTLQQADQPVWVAATGKGWREIAAVPSLGLQGKFQRDADSKQDPWMPVLVVESTPRVAASRVGAVVDARQWAGLLAFLARRDFESSAIVLDDLVGRRRGIQNAVAGKVENPVAAVAGALVAVATRRLAELKIPEKWLQNLVNWFPQLPDGPVILAHYYASRGQAGPGDAELKKLLLEAYRRGVPLFSLSVDWLAQGLMDFADDSAVAAAAGTMRRLAQLSDPTRTFTVLRIPVGKDDVS